MLKRTLVAYSMTSTHVQTTMDYLVALKRYLGGEVDYVHVTHDAHMGFDFNAYDAVFHNYCGRLCFPGYVSDSYRRAMRSFQGVKILAVQDEYDHTDLLKSAISDLGFHVVLTCVPQDSLDYVYPRAEFPDVEFVTVLTGYVPDGFADLHGATKPIDERPILLGYRGRDIGPRYGRLGFEKYEVGRRMREECMKRGIACDIAMDEASRIYGEKWFEFIGNCRAMLGSESGSNVFDFDGSIKTRYEEMTAAKGSAPSYEEFLPLIAQRDSEIEMGQISPRVFECAVMRTPMVLIRGGYSGAIEPDTHYIALDRDFSNAGEVLERLKDTAALAAMAERAYTHLVASGSFSYPAYVGRLRSIIDRHLERLPPRPAAVTPARPAEGSREAVLLETPAALPRGMADYRRKQTLLNADYYAGAALHQHRTLVPGTATYASIIRQLQQQVNHLGDLISKEGAVEVAKLLTSAESRVKGIQSLAEQYADKRAALTRKRETHGILDFSMRESINFEIAICDQEWIELASKEYDMMSKEVALTERLVRTLAASGGETGVRKRIEIAWRLGVIALRKPKLEVARSIVRRIPILHAAARMALSRFGQRR